MDRVPKFCSILAATDMAHGGKLAFFPEIIQVAQKEFVHLARVLRVDRIMWFCGTMIFAGAIILIACHTVLLVAARSSEVPKALWEIFYLGFDHSFAESYIHAVAFLAGGLFSLCYFESRSRIFVFLAFLSFFIWFDDSAQLHERFGILLAATLGFENVMGIRAQDFGELLVWGTAFMMLMVLLTWALRQRQSGDLGLLIAIGLCFGVLVVCGVLVDMLQIASGEHLLTIIEDGGEMLAICAITTISIGVMRNLDALYVTAGARR
jgi:hypothetical protein